MSTGRKVSPNTVSDYIYALTEAFVFYLVERFDIQGKHLLQQNQKLYIADTGLRRFMLPRRNSDLGFTLENIIYLELYRRGYEVYVGKNGTTEVEFMVRKNNITEYFLVTASMMDEFTFKREITPLKSIFGLGRSCNLNSRKSCLCGLGECVGYDIGAARLFFCCRNCAVYRCGNAVSKAVVCAVQNCNSDSCGVCGVIFRCCFIGQPR